jgi:hypothetical protein
MPPEPSAGEEAREPASKQRTTRQAVRPTTSGGGRIDRTTTHTHMVHRRRRTGGGGKGKEVGEGEGVVGEVSRSPDDQSKASELKANGGGGSDRVREREHSERELQLRGGGNELGLGIGGWCSRLAYIWPQDGLGQKSRWGWWRPGGRVVPVLCHGPGRRPMHCTGL